MNLRRLSILAFSVATSFLAGCGFTTTTPASPGGASAMISGRVHGGQQPVLGATVSVMAVGTSGYGSAATVLASVTSSLVDGSFSFPSGAYTCPYAGTPVYLLAQGGDAGGGYNASLALAAGIGDCGSASSQQVNINEVTTVATAYAMGQFFTTTLGSTDDFGSPAPLLPGQYMAGLVMANKYTIPTLVNLAYGTVNANTSGITIEAAKIYSIANTLAACVNSSGSVNAGDPCYTLFASTVPPGGVSPFDTLQAAVQMSLYPYNNVSTLYNLGTPTAPFVGLATAPNDWTVGVSYKTPSMGLGVSGIVSAAGTSSNIDIDNEGRVWFPSNLSGAVGLGYFDPVSASFNGPFNPGGDLVQPQYVAIDLNGLVWATDQASGYAVTVAQDNPASVGGYFYGNGSLSFYGGPITVSQDGSIFWEEELTDGSAIYLASMDPTYSHSALEATFLNTPTGLVAGYDGISASDYFIFSNTNATSSPCDIEYQLDESGWTSGVMNIGTPNTCTSGGVAVASQALDIVGAETSANALCSSSNGCWAPPVTLDKPEGIATDGNGNLWVANSGAGSISTLGGYFAEYAASSDRQYIHNASNGETMGVPYGLAVDGSGNVWVSNAGCVTANTTPCTPSPFHLSELIGAAAPTITPLAAQMSGTSAGAEPQLKHGNQAGRGSPLLKGLPAGSKLDHPPAVKGVKVM